MQHFRNVAIVRLSLNIQHTCIWPIKFMYIVNDMLRNNRGWFAVSNLLKKSPSLLVWPTWAFFLESTVMKESYWKISNLSHRV